MKPALYCGYNFLSLPVPAKNCIWNDESGGSVQGQNMEIWMKIWKLMLLALNKKDEIFLNIQFRVSNMYKVKNLPLQFWKSGKHKESLSMERPLKPDF